MKIKRYFNELRFRVIDRQTKFIKIYRKNLFQGSESISGPGSSLEQTQVIRDELPHLITAYNIKTLLDAPCGDFHWMKEVQLDLERYIGIDIVPELIRDNQKKFGNKNRKFIVMDIVKERLPAFDIIMCRDCFIHLSNKDISSAIRNIAQSGIKYLLTTTFTEIKENRDIVTGRLRFINLQKHPFDFPAPLRLINEQCTEDGGKYADKSLALWRVKDIIAQ